MFRSDTLGLKHSADGIGMIYLNKSVGKMVAIPGIEPGTSGL